MRKSIKGRNQIKQIIIYLKNTLPYNIPIYTPQKITNHHILNRPAEHFHTHEINHTILTAAHPNSPRRKPYHYLTRGNPAETPLKVKSTGEISHEKSSIS